MSDNSFSFWVLTVLTLGNYYSYSKGREDALSDCSGCECNNPYSDWQDDWNEIPVTDFTSRPVRGNAKKGNNY